MSLTRATPLLTTRAQVVDLTAHPNLATLEDSGEFTVADTLAAAHQWVFDKVKARLGATAVAALTNETALERAVAYRFLELVAAAGLLSSEVEENTRARDYYGGQAALEVKEFEPDYSDDADEPPNTQGMPSVTNLSSTARFTWPRGG